MPATQRLVVCLDGTWNRQDSSTNVLHHCNLVQEGPVQDNGIVQKRFYHEGVGTGILDSLTGGGFGFGLEATVRDAYNWLVENCHEYGEGRQVDEIYVFGFSRGAYTARSLVGFIAQRGLLRRGAPITVQQLWGDYCLLGRQKEDRKSIWEKILGIEDQQVRSFTAISSAKCRGEKTTRDEDLLLEWSRRVPIKYLGIYDTVGAIGWDALAIPGLTSRLALHNNVRPTTIIQHCRHALAIEEQRSSFNHTPFTAYLQEGAEELERLEPTEEHTIAENRLFWSRRIEQRWFVGAHSNIGGGYANNRLAQRPLEWVLAGAAQCGLICEPLPSAAPVTKEDVPRDSYKEFVPPLWEMILRNKRHFRVIDPDLTLQAPRYGHGLGFALETINEVVDPSVILYWANSPSPIPPNLECYFRRWENPLPDTWRPAEHVWLREKGFVYAALVVWTVAAVFGVYALARLGGFNWQGLPLWFAWSLAIFFPFVDWAESKVAFGQAVGAGGPRARAFLDAVYWTRTLGFVLFVFGLLYGGCLFIASGLRHQWPVSGSFLSKYWVVPLVAALPAVLVTKARSKFAWLAVVSGPSVLALSGGLLFSLGASVHVLFPEVTVGQFWDSSRALSLPGLLLSLQLSGVYLWRSLLWVREPLIQANLGSITKLQFCPTPKRVTKCLNDWRDSLANTLQPDPSPSGFPSVNLRRVLRLALWRDIIGLIPVYTVVFLFGLKFATLVPYEHWAALFMWAPFTGLAQLIRSTVEPVTEFWWMFPLLAALANYMEDICHLRYCRLYENMPPQAVPSLGITLFSFVMTLIKEVALIAAGVITTFAILAETRALFSETPNWHAKLAIVLTGMCILGVVLAVVANVLGTIRKRNNIASLGQS